MATDSASRVEGQPPELPVKKHRSSSLSRSSMESDCIMLSPVGLHHQTYVYSDVFSEPTDCHADQCPIHQRYDRFRHQERYFSDGTPPPIPKKRLARTLSLPGNSAPPVSPLSPVSPLLRHPQNFDNPVYMLAPIPNTCFSEETEAVEPASRSSISLQPFSQLSFDTPDEHLPYLFSGFDDQRVVSQGIQHRHLLFLRSMAQSVEAKILLQRETSEREVSPYQPQDFLLYGGSEPKLIGDTVYYSVHSPKFPGRVLGLKVHKRISADTKHNSSHVNVDDVIVYFQPSNTLRDDPIYSYGQDLSSPLKIGCTASKSPCGGSTESDKHLTNTSLPSIQSLLLQGHSVSIVRDLPHVTLEDFVLDSSSLQSTERLVYDRQLCVLLVQILTASQHLYNVSATAAELRPRDILLVWPSRERDGSENKLKQDTPEGKRVSETSRARDRMEWEKTEKKGSIQALWRTRGSARVVLTPRFSAQPEPHSLVSVKSQIAALIQHCLYSQGPTPFKSSYRSGLLYISSLLQNESTGPQMADMVAMLQVLLWGPRVPLFNLRGYTTTAVHNWLTIKRALLVMRLAEKGLIQDQSALSWDDCMCLQYLSFTDPETVVSVTSQLWLNLKVD